MIMHMKQETNAWNRVQLRQVAIETTGGYFYTVREFADGVFRCACGVNQKGVSTCEHVRKAKVHFARRGRKESE